MNRLKSQWHRFRGRCRAARFASSLVGVVLGMVSASALAAPPEEVWAGFNPRAEGLDLEVIKEWGEGGITCRECYFTGMTFENEPVRVYALCGAPAGGKSLPGVLHIHGGGQTCYLPMVKFWAERGYAALSFDYTGKWETRDKYTQWGKLVQGNTAQSSRWLQATEPSVKVSTWYLWARVARRALTCLERQPGVDPARLGVFGVSNGGSLVWICAGIDRRVRAACAIYGVGWNSFPDELDAVDPRAQDGSTRLWRESMEPESYAALVRCPLLFLNASNDQHGKMDWAFRTLERVKSDWRQIHSPRVRHHLCQAESQDLELWMDRWLKQGAPWPKTPAARVELGREGVPELVVQPDLVQPLGQVELLYALENRNPKNRFWRSAAGLKQGDTWRAVLPILDAQQPLYAFANVRYVSGVSLGSVLVSVVPASLGAASVTDRATTLIDDFSHGIQDWVTTSTSTDPLTPIQELLAAGVGPEGIAGVTVTRPIVLMTHKIGDPKWRAPAGTALSFRFFVDHPRQLRVVAHEREFAVGHRKYSCQITLKPVPAWQDIRLAATDLKTDVGESLGEWSKANALELDATGTGGREPVYTRFQWIK